MKYFIIAGEASGDLHGSSLVQELLSQDSRAEIMGWGGDKMKEAGAKVVQHYRDTAYMGFAEVVRHLPKILRHMKICKNQIIEFAPDVLILIDYPGFNLRIAKWAHRHAIKICYYIAPQLWAWNVKRTEIIKRYVNKLLVILPFEKAFFAKYDIDAMYVGHPLMESIEHVNHDAEEKIIALLPGSRKQEVKRILPIMLDCVREFSEYNFIIAGTSAIPQSVYTKILTPNPPKNVTVWIDRTYPLLNLSSAAVVTSGTATLETALHRVPQVVVYKGSWISYLIAKRLVKVQYISLVNLIAEREIVPELIQNNFTRENLAHEVKRITDDEYWPSIKEGYKNIRKILGNFRSSYLAAQEVIMLAKQ